MSYTIGGKRVLAQFPQTTENTNLKNSQYDSFLLTLIVFSFKQEEARDIYRAKTRIKRGTTSITNGVINPTPQQKKKRTTTSWQRTTTIK